MRLVRILEVLILPKYNTKQRQVLLSYLALHTDEQISARQIEEALRDDSISLSAIYRNLADLEKEGHIKRCVGDSSREAYFQYIEPEVCRNSIHLACRVCGRYFHMDAASAEALIRNVKTGNGFQVEKTDSVLYGVCKDCGK